jgi:signal transduction histidine kinase
VTGYRICQEALTNVHKHARASRVEISLSTVDSGTLFRVTDDGVGTAVTGTDPGRDHFGLIEMRERAESAHGWWSMSSKPGEGTSVEFWLPSAPDEQR